MINVMNMSYRYGRGEEALKNINLNVKEGTITALIGSNGSGKSTLLKLISKTNEKHLKYDGEIELVDKNIKNMEYKKVSQIIGLLEQRSEFSDSASDSINVEKFIVFGKYNRKNLFENYTEKDYLEVNKIMTELKINNLYGRETSQLSGGELQKVFIAKILVQDTPVILLDEPFNNLDITFQKELIKLLKKLKMQGKTIIIAMHELNIAINECDNIVLLEKGVVNYCGTSNEFVNQVISKAIDSELVNIELFQYDNKWYIK